LFAALSFALSFFGIVSPPIPLSNLLLPAHVKKENEIEKREKQKWRKSPLYRDIVSSAVAPFLFAQNKTK
jgi:hypothetical protein